VDYLAVHLTGVLHGYCTICWSCLHQHFPRHAAATFLYQGNLEQGLLRLGQTLIKKLCGIVYGSKSLQILTTGCRARASSSLVSFKAVHIQYATKITYKLHNTSDGTLFQRCGPACTITTCSCTLRIHAGFLCSCVATCPNRKHSNLNQLPI